MAKLNTEAAAKMMGIDPSTLRGWRMVHHGPPFYKYSDRNFRYDEQDIEAWCRERRYDPSVRATLEGTNVNR